jgi:hypothetical protein
LIGYFILGVCLLIGVLLLSRWFIAAEPKRVIVALRWAAVVLALTLGGFLMWSGRHALAALAAPALIPVILRLRSIWQHVKAAAGPTPGQRSSIRTRYLHMTLDHDTGEMDGSVVEGRSSGRLLSEMSLAEQLELWNECRAADAQSATVLEAYLDRVHGATWREAAGDAAGRGGGAGGGGGAAGGGPMTRQEAYEILGLSEGAPAAEVRAAHRRLMQKLHPDHGGSNYLAAKINEAKDLLLGT